MEFEQNSEEIEFLEEDDDEAISLEVFKTEETRNKYKKFGKILDSFCANKKRKNSINEENVPVKRYRFQCNLCESIIVGNFGETAAVRQHLNVIICSCYF